MDIVTIVGVLSKILGFGISTWDALKTPELDEKDFIALRGFLDAGSGALGAALSPKESHAAAQHLALVTRAFGQSFGRHWAFNKDLVPTGKFRIFMSKDQQQRSKEIEARTRFATQNLLTPNGLAEVGDFHIVNALTGSPLNTPYYRAFWDAFSNPKLADEQAGEPPLLDLTVHTRREFERHFLAAYWEGVSSSSGRTIIGHIESLEKYRTLLLHELLLKDLSTWNERHLFGNTERSKTPPSYGMPFMPLGEMYVEPLGQVENTKEKLTPILSILTRALRQPNPKVIFVKADFGSGKSLTARTLAHRLATAWLETQEGTSIDQEFPVFVRCADDFPSEGAFELSPTVRRAWKRQAIAFNVDLKTSDSALSVPEPDQRTTYILDGLDEIALGDRRLDALMQRLQEETTERHRFIIFSRPGALPPEHKLKDSIVINLLPFTAHDANKKPGGQVGMWLDKWNKATRTSSPLSSGDLADKGLLGISQTPILLFMIAQSWDDLSGSKTPKTLAEIYEGFFRHIARGKHELDRESNTNVFDASNHLLVHLKSLNELDANASAPDAMLWLMSRVAWEATKLQQRRPPEPLTTRDVDRLLEDELNLRSSSELTSTIRMGLLLAMQADLRAGADHILFGHKSFREFLVARFWADRLMKISLADARDGADLERSLYGARLLNDYAHLEFLLDILNRRDDSERRRIIKWAQSCFENEEQLFKLRKGRPSLILRDDLRATLREAALAIGSEINGGSIEVRESLAFRSLAAWFMATDENLMLLARHSILRSTSLAELNLFDAYFGHSTFEQVKVAHADIMESEFSDIRSFGIDIDISDFFSCTFDRAVFDGGSLSHSEFSECLFKHSSFKHCNFSSVDFIGCTFASAKFDNSRFHRGSLGDCDLSKAVFVDCDFDAVDLSGSNLSKAVFKNCRYTKTVSWPKRFNPSKRPGLHLAQEVLTPHR